MALYQKEKINPFLGCLPMLAQIPVFYSLYKVLSVTIEMRHAPFFGWVHDLSARDPTSIVNLFGALPFHPAAVIGHRRLPRRTAAHRRVAADLCGDHVAEHVHGPPDRHRSHPAEASCN